MNMDMDARRLVAVDPGHFHAALVQGRMYGDIASSAYVFAPAGRELDAHLGLVERFNARKEGPCSWEEVVYRGDDYLERFSAAAKSGELGPQPIVVLAGKNDRKADYALAAVEAGCNVLADKPLAIDRQGFEKVSRAARLAAEKGLLFEDLMTERHEITSILVRELARDRDLYGDQEPGTSEDPAVVKSSVHHFCKLVDGVPLRRPEWYYDTRIQGRGIVDVTTHLVDLVQWSVFPERQLSPSDVEIVSSATWPTVVSPEQYAMSTGGSAPGPLEVDANGEFTWRLCGVSCKVSVAWNFMAPPGTGDTHYSLMRGTRAELEIRQGERESFRPVVYVRSRGDAASTEAALGAALSRISGKWPGVAACGTDEPGVWRIAVPAAYAIGHEAHFGQVVADYLERLKAGGGDAAYVQNMLVKYYAIVEAAEAAVRRGA